MTFEELVDQAIAILERRGRVSYRALKRQFQLEDDVLEDLTVEIIKAQRLAVDEDGEVLGWTGASVGVGSSPAPAHESVYAPHTYTPPYLAEKILTSKAALEGERKQVTVLFADLKGSMELLADRDPEEARQLLDPVLERMMVGFQALCGLPLGEAQLLAGRLEEAHALAERALALAREHQERSNQAYTLRLMGDIAARREPPEHDQAEEYYHQALALADDLGMRPLVVHCHLGLGTLYARIGCRAEAHTALSAAIELYRAMEMTFWLPQAEATLAQVEKLS